MPARVTSYKLTGSTGSGELKILSGTLSDLNDLDPDPVQIWVQTVCKGLYQQITKVTARMERHTATTGVHNKVSTVTIFLNIFQSDDLILIQIDSKKYLPDKNIH